MDNDDDLDALVLQAALRPQPGFTQRVMHNLPLGPAPVKRWSRWRWLLLLTATGLAGGAALGRACTVLLRRFQSGTDLATGAAIDVLSRSAA